MDGYAKGGRPDAVFQIRRPSKTFSVKDLVSITRQMPRPRHKNKAIIRLSSHPSRYSLCFDSKLVVVVVIIGLMETINILKW